MDIFLVILAGFFMLLGILGSFLPILPGPITSWVGLLLLHFTNAIPMNWVFLGITLGIAIAVWLLDYMIPALGAKKFGGSKAGMIGATLGLVLGIVFLGPLGIIIGPFMGAFVGEQLSKNDSKRAFKAAIGSFLGFLTSTLIKFIISIIYLGFFIIKIWGKNLLNF